MIAIRQAVTEDAATIQSLAEAIWWPTYGPILAPEQIRYMLDHIYDVQSIRRQIAQGEQDYLLALDHEEPVGFASFSVREEDRDIYKLHKLYCLPEKQGKGLGVRLLSAVEQTISGNGSHTLDLNVNKYNPAKGFYEKMGFRVIYEEDIPIGPFWMNDYVMRKSLTR